MGVRTRKEPGASGRISAYGTKPCSSDGTPSDLVIQLDGQADVRCAIVTGAGERAFAAGANIAAQAEMSAADARGFARMGHTVGAGLEGAHFPFIAAANGFALGSGCELALACDFIYASDKAKLGQPEVSLGVIPGFGGTRRIGVGRARALLHGRRHRRGGSAAHRLGERGGAARRAAREGAGRRDEDRVEGAAGDRAVQARDRSRRGRAAPGRELELQAFAGLLQSTDQREGMKAFVEKRKAACEGE